MNQFSKMFHLPLASLLVTALSLSAVAQVPREAQVPEPLIMETLPGTERPGADPLQLLQIEKVQKELDLTQAQIEELKKIDQQAHSSLAQRSRGTEQKPELQAHVVEVREQVAQVLNQQQLKRLRGILLQLNGVTPEPPAPRTRGTIRPDPLNLTLEQQQNLTGLQEQMQQQIRSNITRTRSSNPQEACQTVMANRERIAPILEKNQQQAIAKLSEEQRVTLEKFEGEPFEIAAPSCSPTSSVN